MVYHFDKEVYMLIKYELITELEVNSLDDLHKLKPLIDNSKLKVNKSELARELNCDWKTVNKYINGYEKKPTRNKSSTIDDYYNIIKELLEDNNKTFSFKRVLWQYLKDNYGLSCTQSNFRYYIIKHPKFNNYFKEKKTTISKPTIMRFETQAGKQAQLDWKESIKFVLKDGEVVIINIFVLLLSYSRFRVYRLSINKTQDILFNFLLEAFETFGGVPIEILTDNMKTVMDEPRTEYSPGVINNKFKQFSDDFGFITRPCIAARPETKSKVESPMKILEELKAYSGDLTYDELNKKLQEINDRENNRYHESYNTIPILSFEKEKNFLNQLPASTIRSYYRIETTNVKVNNQALISYKSNFYSVPPEYIGKTLKLQVYDNRLHLHSNIKEVAVHNISSNKLNYQFDHYIADIKKTFPFSDDKITDIAKENLKLIGERYNDTIRTVKE